LTDDYVFESPNNIGNYTASVITWPTAFIKDDEDFDSDTFREFLDSRITISERLNALTYNDNEPLGNGFYDGWGPTSQDVVIPAFVAAYTGEEASGISLDAFKTKVQPNWRVTYDGLSKNKRLKQYFKQFSVSHTYRSTFSTQYVTNLDYEETADGLPIARDQSDFANFIPQRQINTVTISEQLSPLLGFDMTIKTKKKNDPQLKLEWKKDRSASLGLSNYQITETKSNTFVLGVGYKFTEVPNPFARKRGSRLPIAFLSDTELEVRTDLTIRDNVTIIRKMVERQNQVTAGQKLISIKTSADMKVSDKLTLRFFYDHQLTRPKISTSFPTSNISTGVSLRFTLTQ
ncbi:MAG: cell surface protein SprA, partial [Flavobacteriales bacterium]|nr:cell surface protein SprA [Flavobacteriales bacterium]